MKEKRKSSQPEIAIWEGGILSRKTKPGGKRLLVIGMVLSILIIPKVKAITSEEVLYDKNGEEKVLKETLDELYTELNICYTKGDATSNDIVSGKSAYVKGKLVNGSMPVLQSGGYNSASEGHANATSTQYGAHSVGDTTRYIYLGIPRNTNTGNNTYIRTSESAIAQVLGVTGAKIAQGQSIAGVSGTYTSDATATASQILSGATAYVKGSKITGTIKSKGATTYTPGTSNQTISAGQYLSGAQTIKGDANLTAGNIKSGVSIFGVSGTFTSDATATSGDIAEGKTAYVKGAKVTGTGGNWKVKEFETLDSRLSVTTITSTGTVPTWKYGSWVNIATKGQNTVFSADLGFRPTEVLSCNVNLEGNYEETEGYMIYSYANFRHNRGYSSGTTTAAYYYDYSVKASEDVEGHYTNAKAINESTKNYSGYETLCWVYNGRIYISIKNVSNGTGSGIPIQTRADKFFISGKIVYK